MIDREVSHNLTPINSFLAIVVVLIRGPLGTE